jgi:DNA-binding transcriptional regulator PaaX
MVQGKSSRQNLTRAVLLLLGSGAVLSAAILFPGLGVLYREYKKWQNFEKRRLRETVRRLHQQKLVKVTEKDGQLLVELTEKGKTRAQSFRIDEMKIKKLTKWDGLWRVVIFDIPEKKRLARDILRDKLKQLGFYKLQKSVFVHPFPCRDEIEFIKEVYEISPDVIFLEAESLDKGGTLRSHFNI